MHKVLVAFDGSENALRAVRFAISLAKENGPIAIHLVTAHEEPIVYGEIAVYVSRERMVELQRQHSEKVMVAAAF